MKKVLYGLFFCFAVVISFYLTFPMDALRPYIEKQMSDALRGELDKVEHLMTPPRVQLGHLSLWRLSGFSVQNVEIHMGSSTPEPGPSLQLEQLKFRFGIFSTLMGKPQMEFDSHIYSGRARGRITMTQQGSLSYLWLDMKQINLAQLRGPVPDSGLKMSGLLNLDIDLSLGNNPVKEASGDLKLDFKELSIGPGVFEIPGGLGGFTLPRILLGHLTGKASVYQGKMNIQDLMLVGGDLEAHVNSRIELADNILLSPLRGSGWFKMKPEFQKANPKISTILELSPDIKAAEDAEGRVHFTLIGSLMQPTPKWGKES